MKDGSTKDRRNVVRWETARLCSPPPVPPLLALPAMGEHPVESVASQASPRQSVLSLTLARSDSSTASDVVVEEQQLTSWDDFSLAYSQGQWTSAPSLPPSASTAFPPESTPRWFGTIPPEPWRSSPLGTPQAALGLYQEKGYLSAIHGRE